MRVNSGFVRPRVQKFREQAMGWVSWPLPPVFVFKPLQLQGAGHIMLASALPWQRGSRASVVSGPCARSGAREGSGQQRSQAPEHQQHHKDRKDA